MCKAGDSTTLNAQVGEGVSTWQQRQLGLHHFQAERGQDIVKEQEGFKSFSPPPARGSIGEG